MKSSRLRCWSRGGVVSRRKSLLKFEFLLSKLFSRVWKDTRRGSLFPNRSWLFCSICVQEWAKIHGYREPRVMVRALPQLAPRVGRQFSCATGNARPFGQGFTRCRGRRHIPGYQSILDNWSCARSIPIDRHDWFLSLWSPARAATTCVTTVFSAILTISFSLYFSSVKSHGYKASLQNALHSLTHNQSRNSFSTIFSQFSTGSSRYFGIVTHVSRSHVFVPRVTLDHEADGTHVFSGVSHHVFRDFSNFPFSLYISSTQ